MTDSERTEPVPSPRLRTSLCDLVGVRYPIVQTGMGWVSDARLTAATANAGGLGILASATLTLAQTEQSIEEIARLTDAPFGVNLRADATDAEQRVRLLIERGVRVASFALAPRRELVEQLKAAGTVVIPSVGARRHAEKVAAWGADAVIVQGSEGGGHVGAVPTSLLVPQVVDAVDIPVVAAGGFFDGRGLVAALAYGAAGIAMGTRFLLTQESPAPDAVKARYLAASVADTVVTTALDGVPQRVLRNAAIDALLRSGPVGRLRRSLASAALVRRTTGATWGDLLREGVAMRQARGLRWRDVVSAANTPALIHAAMVDGRVDAGILATGQVAGLIDELPTCDVLIRRVMAQAEVTLAALEAGSLPSRMSRAIY